MTFTVTSSAPTLVGVSTPTVTIPAGGQTANALLNGLLPGPSTVTVSNAAYVTATSTVTTAAALDLQQTSATLNSSFGAQVDINFTSNNQGIAAPAPGVPVAAVITDATCLKAVTTPVTDSDRYRVGPDGAGLRRHGQLAVHDPAQGDGGQHPARQHQRHRQSAARHHAQRGHAGQRTPGIGIGSAGRLRTMAVLR